MAIVAGIVQKLKDMMEGRKKQIKEQIQDITKKFILECLTSPQALSGKWNENEVWWIKGFVDDTIHSKDFAERCLAIINRYGSIELATYDLIGGGVYNSLPDSETSRGILEMVKLHLDEFGYKSKLF